MKNVLRLAIAVSVLNLIFIPAIYAQKLFIGNAEAVSPELEAMYAKGLAYLQKTQTQDGDFQGQYGNDPGVIGLCIVAMLARGDDPNNGPYSDNIKRGLSKILRSANASNGYIGNSMYSHGFATLALAESYGVVNDDKIGPALKKAVDLILSAQTRNPRGAWRYGPDSRDADTTVSGAISVALLASANAGIKVPDEAIQKALKFYESCACGDGGFGYTGRDSGNYPRTAIAALVFALAKKKDSNMFKGAMSYLQGHNASEAGGHYYHYGLYYASQAFFHTGTEAWDQWNEVNIKSLKIMQTESGAWNGQQGPAFTTAAALLSMALNFRYLPIYER